MTTATATPRRTALFEEHARLGATFTDFGGWAMPLKYESELAEHRAVRNKAGLFDLSHMGEIRVEGPDAGLFLNTALAGNLAVIAIGRAKYSLMLAENGGIIDDLITYRLAEDRYLVVPNAGNTSTVFAAFQVRATGFDVRVVDETAETSLIAVQGPNSAKILLSLLPESQRESLEALSYYSSMFVDVDGIRVLLARTGYTGEDGFEIYLENAQAVDLWRTLEAAGQRQGLSPAGLAARDSLRLEAGMPLYGNELTRNVSPFEAGLGPVVSFKKAETFVGRDALEAHRDETPDRVLVGLRGAGRRAGRAGYPVFSGERQVGEVTSGQPSPTLGYPISLAYVDAAHAALGTDLEIDLRGKREAFEVVALPFYRRGE